MRWRNAEVRRKRARKANKDKKKGKKKKDFAKAVITPEKVNQMLGPQKFREQQSDKKNEVGATVGLGVDRSRRLDSDHRSRDHGRPRQADAHR